jgi:phosphatidylethanolamine/phosphatidyl-N-methylethanolamine N-methyltransferase
MNAGKMTTMAPASERDRNYWERHAANYDASLRVLARPLPRMLELTMQSVRGADNVLEVAAGTGLVTTAIAANVGRLTATDYTSAMVNVLRERTTQLALSNVTCEQADIYALRYQPESFDVVVAANVLHLVPDLPGALAALRSMVRPNGKLVLPTFCHDQTMLSAVVSRVLALTGFPGHRRFTGSSLRAELEKHGIRVQRHEVIGGLIPVCYVEGTRA